MKNTYDVTKELEDRIPQFNYFDQAKKIIQDLQDIKHVITDESGAYYFLHRKRLWKMVMSDETITLRFYFNDEFTDLNNLKDIDQTKIYFTEWKIKPEDVLIYPNTKAIVFANSIKHIYDQHNIAKRNKLLDELEKEIYLLL